MPLLASVSGSYSAETGVVPADILEIEWTAELSREIPWFEAATGKIVRDRIVRRFSLLCNPGASVRGCDLTVVSFPARNCMDQSKPGTEPLPLLEAPQSGIDADLFESGKLGSADLKVLQREENSVLIEFTSHEPHQSKNSMLVTYPDRFGPNSGAKVPVKITGVESGVRKDKYLHVGGDEVVKCDYRQMSASTVSIMKMQSQALVVK